VAAAVVAVSVVAVVAEPEAKSAVHDLSRLVNNILYFLVVVELAVPVAKVPTVVLHIFITRALHLLFKQLVVVVVDTVVRAILLTQEVLMVVAVVVAGNLLGEVQVVSVNKAPSTASLLSVVKALTAAPDSTTHTEPIEALVAVVV
jgi:hypothetical protein